jgi:hypothetical protein
MTAPFLRTDLTSVLLPPATISAGAGNTPKTAPAWLRALEMSLVRLTLPLFVMSARIRNKNARRHGIPPRASAASRDVTRHYDGSSDGAGDVVAGHPALTCGEGAW